jgi:hypothetical protein
VSGYFSVQAYKSKVEDELTANPKLFWSHLKAKRGGSSAYPASMSHETMATTDNTKICDMFASYFSSVYITDSNDVDLEYNSSLPQSLINNSQCFSSVIIDKEALLAKLKSMDCSKGAGPDDIPPIFIVSCASQLVEPLWQIFNKSLSSGVFPTAWKIAKVVPIPKSGDDSIVSNYRPISILSCCAKVLESLVYPYIQRHIKPYLTDHQHGFVSSRSTCTNLVSFTELLTSAMDSGKQTDVIYTDFSKAFDKVSHSILIYKLSAYGVSGNMLQWLQSYLTERVFYVVVNGFESSYRNITSGVPQGSHLGPILFNLFINDVIECFHHSTVFMYADDLKFARVIDTTDDITLLQSDIIRLSSWCEHNLMHINIKKCIHMKFTRKQNVTQSYYHIDGCNLIEVENTRDLGVLFDNKLTFVPHMENIVKRASRILGFVIRSTKSFRRSATKILLYNSLVKSILEYCSVVWRPHYATHSLRLERIQKRFTRHLAFQARVMAKRSISYQRKLQYFKMDSLEDRRTLLDATFLYKLVNHKVDCPQLLTLLNFRAPSRIPRNAITPLCAPLRRSVSGTNSPICRLCKIANGCKADMHYDPLNKFISSLRKYFLKHN